MKTLIRIEQQHDGSTVVEINAERALPNGFMVLPPGVRFEPLVVDDRPSSPVPRPRFRKLDSSGAVTESATWAAVHDTATGLIWSAQNVGKGKRLKHAAAVKACSALELAGATDWRLPTRAELLTLVDDTRHEPAIDTDFFPDTESAWYWTGTPCAWRAGSASWCVVFDLGFVLSGDHDGECFVRAVRSVWPAAGQ